MPSPATYGRRGPPQGKHTLTGGPCAHPVMAQDRAHRPLEATLKMRKGLSTAYSSRTRSRTPDTPPPISTARWFRIIGSSTVSGRGASLNAWLIHAANLRAPTRIRQPLEEVLNPWLPSASLSLAFVHLVRLWPKNILPRVGRSFLSSSCSPGWLRRQASTSSSKRRFLSSRRRSSPSLAFLLSLRARSRSLRRSVMAPSQYPPKAISRNHRTGYERHRPAPGRLRCTHTSAGRREDRDYEGP